MDDLSSATIDDGEIGGGPAVTPDSGPRDSDPRFDATTQESGAAADGAPSDAGADGTGDAGPWTLMLSGDDLNVPALVIGNAIEVADMNGDGLLDFVVSHGGFSSAGVFLQQRNGRFAPEQTFAWRGGGAGRGHGIAVGDLNGDGKPDIAGVGQNGISLLLSE